MYLHVCVCLSVCIYLHVCVKACRGNELDDGTQIAHDAMSEPPPPAQRIPIEADFLYAYSTTPGLCLCFCLTHLRIIYKDS